uniref:F-box/FBD/LRR-repeat protein At1g78760 family n=2 Tax=Cajanus cajan TaxID=3821 RepID=A0A151RHE3_CAJCA|nr:Putative F-box/FBD/LRR-repeat protein At1g78760 family [Cajanus cajan]
MERLSLCRRNRRDDKDRLSELPNNLLLHIMSFMETRDAIQTCVLAKRWKNLCKRLNNLSFNFEYSRSRNNFQDFVYWTLFRRDHSISLLKLRIYSYFSCYRQLELLYCVMEYAAMHNVQHLDIDMDVDIELIGRFSFEFDPFVYFYPSLTTLRLSGDIFCPTPTLKLPKILKSPVSLETLRLVYVSFTTSENNIADPFSNCNFLNTLVLVLCSLDKDENDKFFHISNSNLSNLVLVGSTCDVFKIVLSTPNLRSLTLNQICSDRISFACNLLFLEEIIIDSCLYNPVCSIWLDVFSNVKKMTITTCTLDTVLDDLAGLEIRITQSPRFARLESLIVKKDPCMEFSDVKVNRILKYILQNSPLARVDLVKNGKLYPYSILNYR